MDRELRAGQLHAQEKPRCFVDVADDDPQNRQLIEEVCRSDGLDVVGVESGDAVLEAVQGGVFELLLLDAAMPGKDGLEVCRLLKADPGTAPIPIMIVTASHGGGTTGYLIGALFVAAGAGRLTLLRRSGR